MEQAFVARRMSLPGRWMLAAVNRTGTLLLLRGTDVMTLSLDGSSEIWPSPGGGDACLSDSGRVAMFRGPACSRIVVLGPGGVVHDLPANVTGTLDLFADVLPALAWADEHSVWLCAAEAAVGTLWAGRLDLRTGDARGVRFSSPPTDGLVLLTPAEEPGRCFITFGEGQTGSHAWTLRDAAEMEVRRLPGNWVVDGYQTQTDDTVTVEDQELVRRSSDGSLTASLSVSERWRLDRILDASGGRAVALVADGTRVLVDVERMRAIGGVVVDPEVDRSGSSTVGRGGWFASASFAPAGRDPGRTHIVWWRLQ